MWIGKKKDLTGQAATYATKKGDRVAPAQHLPLFLYARGYVQRAAHEFNRLCGRTTSAPPVASLPNARPSSLLTQCPQFFRMAVSCACPPVRSASSPCTCPPPIPPPNLGAGARSKPGSAGRVMPARCAVAPGQARPRSDRLERLVCHRPVDPRLGGVPGGGSGRWSGSEGSQARSQRGRAARPGELSGLAGSPTSAPGIRAARLAWRQRAPGRPSPSLVCVPTVGQACAPSAAKRCAGTQGRTHVAGRLVWSAGVAPRPAHKNPGAVWLTLLCPGRDHPREGPLAGT
jgi:hypothetical protein